MPLKIDKIKNVKVLDATLSPAAVATATSAEQSFTVAGLGVNDIVLTVVKPTAQAGIGIVGFRISAADTLRITFNNHSTGSITPTASEVYKIVVLPQ